MSSQIIGSVASLDPWLSPASMQGAGAAARAWVLPRFSTHVQDIFGFYALQIGASSINTLANSRIAHRWCIADTVQDPRASFYANASALPFFESTLDLVTLPFTLDAHSDPETVIDEVARVLVPEGRVVIAGFNSISLWGATHLLGGKLLPEGSQPFGYAQLKTALADLGLVIERVQYGVFSGSGDSATLLDKLGSRFAPSLGNLYFVVAKKRVMGVRPKRRLAWRMPRLSDLPLNPFPSPNPSGLRKNKTNHA
jgi:SAM-dependent methyltransferase